MLLLKIAKITLIIIEVVLIFNLMIIVHELGHFLAARWRGLVIEKFGIWFGKPIWKKKINGVEYSLGSIPAGGFVALPQLAPMEVMEGKVETPREQLPPISALDKIIVAFAGPLFSFGLAFLFALIVWQTGRPMGEAESTSVVGFVKPGSPAAIAGIQPGDKILAIDGHKVNRFGGMGEDSITWRVARSEDETLAIDLERDGKAMSVYPKPFVPKKSGWWQRKGLRQIGIGPHISALVAEVQPNSPAGRAGLQADDTIVAVNGQKLFGAEDIYEYAANNPGTALTLTVKRGEQELTLPFDPTGVRVAGLAKDSPAKAAGLQVGDVILSIDGQAATVGEGFIRYVATKTGVPIVLSVLRSGETQPREVKVTPQVPAVTPEEEKGKGKIGLILEDDDGLRFHPMGKYRVVHPGPIEQIRLGVMSIVNTVDAVLSEKSHISVQHMGGPVMVMNAYYNILSGPEGIRMALWFSVVLNVNLALLNLLPIPVLDGGHITLALIEAIRRKPVNVRILEFVQTGCALVIISFMIFIAFFDVQDLPFFGGRSSGMKFNNAPTSEVAK
ncbi:MAG: regulator of sigma protease [Chthoniobacter sp.]|nr:regulator of sigma protease [Chthoniobacter sp.]